MTDIDQIIRNKNVARATFRKMTLSQLDKLADVLDTVRLEKMEASEKEAEQERIKNEQLEAIKQQLADAGLSLEDLTAVKKRGRPRKKI